MKPIFNFFAKTLIAWCFLFSPLLYAEVSGFDRLFTTAQERKELQSLRNTASIIIIDNSEDDIIMYPRNLRPLTINGFLHRKDGKHAVWINQQESYQKLPNSTLWQIDQINVHDKKVSLNIPLEDLKISLKVGETYRPKEEDGFEIISSVYDIEVSKQ